MPRKDNIPKKRDNAPQNRPYATHKGHPSGTGKPKAQIKTILHLDDLDEEQEIRDNLTIDVDEPIPSIMRHPNRNPHKPDIDKPSYS